ncbi:hypothetical protein CWI39_0622p0010 [Hamiltosporidium magnivora]|uniref:Uncharacterized protein n=1 Tax=Hamiltosporidium magnivora TaxID=148818 RepID=A0A4Q9LE88_9MICR|nr:hypothetical protein CWI39_0622p0010 [Hamiltosporidium magnivora]
MEKMDIKENADPDFFEIDQKDTNFLTFNKISIKTQTDILYLSFDFHKDKIFNSILKMNFKILVDEFFKIWSFEKCFYDSFIEVEDLKNDDQVDVLCDVIEKIYTLNIDGNEYSSFGWKIKNDHDFIQQLHIIFRICKIHKVNIFDYTILHEPIADILSRIAESIEKIDFFTTLDFLSDITHFGFYVRNKILSDQMEEIFLLENLKIIFSISYFGLNHMGYFEYPISVAEQIHYVSIHDSQIDYCCLQTILKFSCLKSLSISRTFIATLPKTRPFFKNTKLHSVSFVDVRYDDYKKFLNLLNYFKDSNNFKFEFETPSFRCSDLQAEDYDFVILKLFTLPSACMPKKSVYLEYVDKNLINVSLDFYVSFEQLLCILTISNCSSLSNVKIQDYEIKSSEMRFLHEFTNLDSLFLHTSQQKAFLYELFGHNLYKSIKNLYFSKTCIVEQDTNQLSLFENLESLTFHFCTFSDSSKKLPMREKLKKIKNISIIQLSYEFNMELIKFLEEEYKNIFEVSYKKEYIK